MLKITLETKLNWAVAADKRKEALQLLHDGANPNDAVINGTGRLILGNAKSAEMVQLLVAWGARPNATNMHGVTALMNFAYPDMFSKRAVLELLALYAQVDTRMFSTGDTALILAVRQHGHTMAALLLDHDANPMLANKEGLTAFDEARKYGNHEFRRNFGHLETR